MTALIDILISLDHLLKPIADGIAESRCLEMIVDDDHGIAVYLQEEGTGAVTATSIGDELFLDNRIFAINHGDISFQITWCQDRVMVGVSTVEDSIYLRTAKL